MQTFAIVVSVVVALVAIALFAKAIGYIVAVVKIGQPTAGRSDHPRTRWLTMLKETLGHTRMLQWSHVGILHWFIFVGFGFLFFTLVNAFGQLFDAEFALPVIGHWVVYQWATELITWLMLLAILGLITIRLVNRPRGASGRYSRFSGSRMWQGYFVEAVIVGIALCILTLRGAEYALQGDAASRAHFPLTFFVGEALSDLSASTLATLIYLVAMVKIVISFTWMIVISLNTTMGVAWHRFTAWPNIWFKRHADGRPSLGAMQPMLAGGVPIDFENLDELDEDTAFGVGKVEEFSWKDILDFSSCTECGRCQSQCPAWNTEKPLSPKLFVMNLREHAYAKAPYLIAGDGERASVAETAVREAERPLIADADAYGVIDPDVLWSCTSCGACVQQCPVDIEHVDHIMDMRRFQVLVESNFPTELNQLFRGLENKGNPWNMSPTARMDWAKDLPFEVKQVGADVDSLDEVDWLFWVGCAGAYEDRAKKTTRAVAELLNEAGVSFAVLGDGETCSGDPARRAGNEFVFQQLAMQNAEVFKETAVKKVVSTCAHCFNTLKNEYGQFGLELEVVHHTQLLNRLVREGRLTPVAPPAASVDGHTITYHDPCFLGRHNKVYEPPRELLSVIPGASLTEMPRNTERSFCCGAGGARMWMEEKIGKRINIDRTQEAVETGASQIAVGCPFCRVMLSDGLTALQADGAAGSDVEVLDVAQMLLASIRRAPAAQETPAPEAAQAETAESADETDPIDAVLPADAPVHDPGTADTSQRPVTPIPSPTTSPIPTGRSARPLEQRTGGNAKQKRQHRRWAIAASFPGVDMTPTWCHCGVHGHHPFVETLRQDLLRAAEAGGGDVRAAAERLSHALDSAVRLTVMDALSQAASEITHELAGTSVEVRLKGREPMFVVIGQATEPPALPGSPPGADEGGDDSDLGFDGDDEVVARITLRLPESLKARAEELAAKRGQSLNTWLVNAARAAASFNIDVSSTPFGPGAPGRNRASNKRIQGWVR